MWTAKTSNSKEPQQKYRLGMVSVKELGVLNRFYRSQPRPRLLSWLKIYSCSVLWHQINCCKVLSHWFVMEKMSSFVYCVQILALTPNKLLWSAARWLSGERVLPNGLLVVCITRWLICSTTKWRAPSEDSDQSVHLPSLISFHCLHEETFPLSAQRRLIKLRGCPGWVFAGRICHFVGFVVLRLLR